MKKHQTLLLDQTELHITSLRPTWTTVDLLS